MGEWTLFSNHGHVLVCLSNNKQARLRDVAAAVGITERAVQNILRELQDSGMVQVNKHGRCNHYQIFTRKSLRHPLEAHCTVGKLLQLLKPGAAENSDTELTVEKQSGVSKTRTATQARKTESAAAKQHAVTKPGSRMSPSQPYAEVLVAIEPAKAQVALAPTPQAQTKPAGSEPGAKASAEIKSAKKASKDEKKDKPTSDQQGSLF